MSRITDLFDPGQLLHFNISSSTIGIANAKQFQFSASRCLHVATGGGVNDLFVNRC
jgi:hypothetical protein